MKKKLLVLTPFFWPSIGGVQRSLYLYCRFLAGEGFDILVLTGAEAGCPPRETKDGFTIVRFPAGGIIGSVLGFGFMAACKFRLPFRGALFDAWQLQRMRGRAMCREGAKWKPDVILVKPLTGPLQKLAIRIRRTTGAKLAFGTGLHPEVAPPSRAVLRRLRSCDAICVNTEFEKKYLIEHGGAARPEAVHVVGVPADPEEHALSGGGAVDETLVRALEGKPFVLFLGRKEIQKGVGTLADAMSEVVRKHPDARLVLAGESTRAFDKQLRPRIRRSPFILAPERVNEADKRWLLRHALVFAMPSKIDSFGIVYLEAWLERLPVIAADIGAMRCVVSDGQDGMLVPYGDAKALARALLAIYEDPAKARRLGENGYLKTMEMVKDRRAEKKMRDVLLTLFS